MGCPNSIFPPKIIFSPAGRASSAFIFSPAGRASSAFIFSPDGCASIFFSPSLRTSQRIHLLLPIFFSGRLLKAATDSPAAFRFPFPVPARPRIPVPVLYFSSASCALLPRSCSRSSTHSGSRSLFLFSELQSRSSSLFPLVHATSSLLPASCLCSSPSDPMGAKTHRCRRLPCCRRPPSAGRCLPRSSKIPPDPAGVACADRRLCTLSPRRGRSTSSASMAMMASTTADDCSHDAVRCRCCPTPSAADAVSDAFHQPMPSDSSGVDQHPNPAAQQQRLPYCRRRRRRNRNVFPTAVVVPLLRSHLPCSVTVSKRRPGGRFRHPDSGTRLCHVFPTAAACLSPPPACRRRNRNADDLNNH